MSSFTIGVSFGSFVDSIDHIGEVSQFENAKFIEIPISSESVRIADKAKSMGFESALHIPSYELVDRLPWLTDIQADWQVETLLCVISELTAPSFDWKYVVAHYPLATTLTDQAKVERLNRYYLENLVDLIKAKGIPLYIENVAVSSLCYQPEDYDWAVSVCDGLCYDIGHAHTAGLTLFGRNEDLGLTLRFFRRFKERIRCIHLYNATFRNDCGYSVNLHYPFAELGVDKGFMSTAEIDRQIQSLSQPICIVHEPHRRAVEALKSGGDLGEKYDAMRIK